MAGIGNQTKKRRITTRSASVVELDERYARRAARAYFGCANGGRDFDEYDPTEALHALTESEREEIKLGMVEDFQQDEKIISDLITKEKKKRKRERYKANKAARANAWRKRQQSNW